MNSFKFVSTKRKRAFYSFSEDYSNSSPKTKSFPKIDYFNSSIRERENIIINTEEICWNPLFKNTIKEKLRLNDKEFEINKEYKIRNQSNNSKKKFMINNGLYINDIIKKNEKDYIYHCIKNKNYTINHIIEINQIRSKPFEKFNLILDIDLTMIKGVELNKENINFKKKSTDIEVSGIAFNSVFTFIVRYRPYLFNFINELKDYFNFYISTLSHINYANQILNNLRLKTGLYIPPNQIIAKNDINKKDNKFIDDLIPLSRKNDINNTIIFDDNIYSWIKQKNINKNEQDNNQCIKCLIPSKRYVSNNILEKEKINYEILVHNNILEKGYNKNLNYILDVDYCFCIEKDLDSENNKKGQLYYIKIFIKKCIKFSLLSGMSLVITMDYFRKKIFENCKFNLKFLDNEWFYAMSSIINDLGGTITVINDETTHFIIENKYNLKKIYGLKKSSLFINVKYIFQCYFNLYRFNELDKQFKANIIN